MFVLKKYPLPPSSNELYASVRGRLIKSKLAKFHDFQTQSYKIKNLDLINEIKSKLSQTDLLEIDTYFIFHKSRVIGQKGQLKKIDCTNFIKQTHDSLARMIDIDDKQYITGRFFKLVCESEFDEQVIIVIKKLDKDKLIDLRNWGELKL